MKWWEEPLPLQPLEFQKQAFWLWEEKHNALFAQSSSVRQKLTFFIDCYWTVLSKPSGAHSTDLWGQLLLGERVHVKTTESKGLSLSLHFCYSEMNSLIRKKPVVWNISGWWTGIPNIHRWWHWQSIMDREGKSISKIQVYPMRTNLFPVYNQRSPM